MLPAAGYRIPALEAKYGPLENDGFDKARLADIHTPIGLPINSHTPEEIAVSIAAEMISVKNLTS